MQTDTPSETASSYEKFMGLLAKHQQTLKLIVYSLLILNFGYYMFDDWRAAQATLLPDATILQIMQSYATSIDELAWFVILGSLEYETYWMDDDAPMDFKYWAMQIARVICYGMLLHTLYAYSKTVYDLSLSELMVGVTNVCDLAGQDLYIVRNLLYDPITAETCASLSTETEFYKFFNEPVVADPSGLALQLQHSWIDVMDIVCWLSISLSMIFIVVLQDRKIFESPWITGMNRLQIICYTLLLFEAGYWVVYEFYVYTWDTLLWIGGFMAIDANLSQWRDELKDESEHLAAES